MRLYKKILVLLYICFLYGCELQTPLFLNSTSHLQFCERTILSELPYIKDLFIYYYPSYLSPSEKLLLATYWDKFLVILHLEEMQNKIGLLSYKQKFLKDPWRGDVDTCSKKGGKKILCEEENYLPTSSAYILELTRNPQKYIKTKIDPFFSAETVLHWIQYLITNPTSPKNYTFVEKNSSERIDKYPTYPIFIREIPPLFFISSFAWVFFSQFLFIQENESATLVKQVQFLYKKYQNFPFLKNIQGGAVDNINIHSKSYPTHIFIDQEPTLKEES